MPVRRCTVTFADGRGCKHSTEVFAETVLEAAAAGLKAVRETEALDDDAEFDITVELTTVTRHVVSAAKLRDWLNSNSHDPRTQIRKLRVR